MAKIKLTVEQRMALLKEAKEAFATQLEPMIERKLLTKKAYGDMEAGFSDGARCVLDMLSETIKGEAPPPTLVPNENKEPTDFVLVGTHAWITACGYSVLVEVSETEDREVEVAIFRSQEEADMPIAAATSGKDFSDAYIQKLRDNKRVEDDGRRTEREERLATERPD